MLEQAIDFMALVKKELDRQEFCSDQRNNIYMALYQISFEHCVSILALIKQNLYSSAFALARPVIESFLRATWVKNGQDESSLDKAQKGRFPKISDLLKEVERDVAPFTESEFLSSQIKPLISNFHDFTHAGIQSVARKYSGKVMTNQVDFSEIQPLVKLSVLFAYLSLAGSCESQNPDTNLEFYYGKQKELILL